jgi:hypothetical protein
MLNIERKKKKNQQNKIRNKNSLVMALIKILHQCLQIQLLH